MVDSTHHSLAEVTQLFNKEWNGDNPVVFYDFLMSVKSLVTTQNIDPMDAASAIAGTMFSPRVDDDPLREEITMVAGTLETGQAHPTHTWQYLFKLIDELGSKPPISKP